MNYWEKVFQASPVYILCVQTIIGDFIMLAAHAIYLIPSIFKKVKFSVHCEKELLSHFHLLTHISDHS